MSMFGIFTCRRYRRRRLSPFHLRHTRLAKHFRQIIMCIHSSVIARTKQKCETCAVVFNGTNRSHDSRACKSQAWSSLYFFFTSILCRLKQTSAIHQKWMTKKNRLSVGELALFCVFWQKLRCTAHETQPSRIHSRFDEKKIRWFRVHRRLCMNAQRERITKCKS